MSATLDYLLRPINALRGPGVEEICINGPGEAFVWSRGRFERVPLEISAEEIEDIAIVAAAQRRWDVGESRPLLGIDLPNGGGRLQIVLHPCVDQARPSLTLRTIGADFEPTLEALDAGGLFSGKPVERGELTEADRELLALYRAGRWMPFFRAAVRARKTILLAGRTASGKTTLARALIGEVPLDERLITIEDSAEWEGLPHPNRVALFYNRESRDDSGVRPWNLVEAALRMRIGRLMLGEMRDGNAVMAFLRVLASGHDGGISTIHASDPEDALKTMRLMVKQTPAGSAQDGADIDATLRQRIDVIAHLRRLPGEKPEISGVWFNLAEGGQHALAA